VARGVAGENPESPAPEYRQAAIWRTAVPNPSRPVSLLDRRNLRTLGRSIRVKLAIGCELAVVFLEVTEEGTRAEAQCQNLRTGPYI